MDPLAVDPWFSALVFAVLAGSVATWFALVARWQRRGTLLDYEPRSPVPWEAPAAMFAVLFVAMSLLATAGAGPPPDRPEPLGPLEISQRIMGIMLMQSVVIGVAWLIAVLYRASQRDVGLPTYADELARDVGIGVVACLAAVVPVYGLQALMLWLFGPSEHPLVEMVTRGEANVGIILLVSVATVILAPMSEEILFRLLLQGWLEKWEDRQLGWREEFTNDEGQMIHDEGRMTHEGYPASDESSFAMCHSPSPAEPPRRGVAGLPYGWVPILISSLLFAVAHWGYGPDPIAIFMLALVLGYVYQRTHRIVPCIVAHAAFNSVAMLVLWRMVFLAGE